MTDQTPSEQLAIITQDQAIATTAQNESALNEAMFLTPAVTVAAAVERQQQLVDIVSRLLVPCTDMKNFDGADYGVLPGTSTRTLFQPGAEKLALFFGLQVSLSRQDAKEDWDNGFFFYRYKATAYYQGREVTNIERSCHTREAKYAWVWVETPKPPVATVEEMKQLGTGRNRQVWKNNQKTWAWQERRPNPDPWSLQFVIEAMAQKRAYVAVVKKALGATGFFAKEVDVDEFREDVSGQHDQPIPQAPPTQPSEPPSPKGQQAKPKSVSPEESQIDEILRGYCLKLKGPRAADAYFEGVYGGKSLAEKKRAVKDLALDQGSSTPAHPDAIDAEVLVEDASAENEALTQQIESIFKELRALGKSNEDITGQVARICDGEIGLADMDTATLTNLREGLIFWRDSARSTLNKKGAGK